MLETRANVAENFFAVGFHHPLENRAVQALLGFRNDRATGFEDFDPKPRGIMGEQALGDEELRVRSSSAASLPRLRPRIDRRPLLSINVQISRSR